MANPRAEWYSQANTVGATHPTVAPLSKTKDDIRMYHSFFARQLCRISGRSFLQDVKYFYLLLYVVWHMHIHFMSASSTSGLVRVLCLYFSLFLPKNSLSLFFMITFVFVIESHGHWCEDQ
jgi:hypothetical protein